MKRATRDIVAALRRDDAERCRLQTRKGVVPQAEVWIESLGFWVPWNARIIHATLRGFAYPTAIHREQIKRAVRVWRAIKGC